MIISASRRTDIPAYYMPWFMARVREGFAMTRNPMNPAQVRRVDLTPETVSGIVFWSKSPAPLLPCLEALRPYAYYVQYTLNAYGPDLEPDVGALSARLDTFRRLSDRLGPRRMLWRYDPIMFTDTYSEDFHLENFGKLCRALSGHTERVTLSALDLYAKIRGSVAAHGLRAPAAADRPRLFARMAQIAKSQGIETALCCEGSPLPEGILPGRCVDAERLSRIAGRPLSLPRDRNQRPGCACAQSVDIGAYNTCLQGCVYCYASYNAASARRNHARHDPASAFLLPPKAGAE